MADFGKAGKMTIRENDNAVLVNISAGEHLFFKLTVKGAEPIFTFACKHRAHRSAKDFPGHPKKTYEWNWSKGANESDAPDDRYGIGMLFIAAIKYTLLVEHRNRDGVLINKLKDIDYESQDPIDSFTETIRVFTV